MTFKDKTAQLEYTAEAKELLTPFRRHVLESLLEIGRRELGSALKEATVGVDNNHWEATPPTLELTLVADIDRYEWTRAGKAMVEAELELEASWTEAEREDSVRMINYVIFPLRI